MQQSIIWTNADPIHWRIYVALGGDGLRCYQFSHKMTYTIWHPEWTLSGIFLHNINNCECDRCLDITQNISHEICTWCCCVIWNYNWSIFVTLWLVVDTKHKNDLLFWDSIKIMASQQQLLKLDLYFLHWQMTQTSSCAHHCTAAADVFQCKLCHAYKYKQANVYVAIAEQCVGSRWTSITFLIGWNVSASQRWPWNVNGCKHWQSCWTLSIFASVYVDIR